MRYGSVCSGIESASLAWEAMGWQAAWFAEIEPFPSAVLAHHWPDVQNLGDMTTIADKVAGGEIEAPDVLVGGTPCQAFSVAGMRGGLTDPRGQLTISYVELANAIDTRRSVLGHEPCITVWENVPGVLSDRENAFGCFLGALAGEDGPIIPAGKKWTNAGCVFGPQRAIAWRVIDAQYFGVAQRRRRVFVVSSAREGFDPTAVLFESEGVRRDIAPSREAREEVTHPVAPSLVSSGRGVERCGETRGQDPVVAVTCMAHGQGGAEVAQERSPTLTCNHEAPIAAYSTSGAGYWRDGVGALRAREQYSDENLAVTYPILEPGKRTGKSTTDLRAGLGIGSDGDPMYTLQAGAQHGGCCVSGDIAHTLNTANNGKGCSEDGTGRGVPTIAQTIALRGREGGATAELGGEVATALRASTGGGDKPHVLTVHGTQDPCVSDSTAFSLGRNNGAENTVLTDLAVRRLTPVECERLQGFNDNHTRIPWRGKTAEDCPDGPRYKAIGNSKAVPCIAFIGRQIQEYLS